ncbi:MAG: glycine cleavage system aminomethyltransferase GcvT [Actinomycetota bacterium]
MSATHKHSPLLEVHRRLGARIVNFAGWDMPLQFSGVVAEHRAVRGEVGVFDVSHLGKLRVSGAGAGTALQEALTADVLGLEIGRASYSLVLTESGGCIDDVFVYRRGNDEWLVVPNAANTDAVGAAIASSAGRVVDEWDRWAILAIQGPASFELFERVFPGTGATDLALHEFRDLDVLGETGMVARTGYTGERGFELYAPWSVAPKAFDELLAAGGTPVGLGARDTLRLEMGYALYGHELTLEVSPLEAGLGWVLAWDTPFRGRDACRRIKEEGPARRLFGISCRERGVPRQHHRVLGSEDSDQSAIGEVTSGNFSPTLNTGIALALGERARVPEEGSEVAIEARGRRIRGDIVKPPFVKRSRG